MDGDKAVKRLMKSLKSDFADWNRRPQMIELHWQQPIAELKKYAAASLDFVSVDTETESLLAWHLTLYEATALNKAENDQEQLGSAAKYAAWRVLFEEPPARMDRGGPLLKDKAACALALQAICGWERRAQAVGEALREGLDTPLLDLRTNDRHDAGALHPHFWFLMHLFCAAQGAAPIDVALYSYPESMAPYDRVLADWRSTDLAQVAQWVEDMAEHHVRATDGSDPQAVQEFDHPDHQLFPYEILAFLRLREWTGLANPTAFAHPLMRQPLAWLPPQVPLPDPATPLLDQVIARYRQEYPDLRMLDGA